MLHSSLTSDATQQTLRGVSLDRMTPDHGGSRQDRHRRAWQPEDSRQLDGMASQNVGEYAVADGPQANGEPRATALT